MVTVPIGMHYEKNIYSINTIVPYFWTDSAIVFAPHSLALAAGTNGNSSPRIDYPLPIGPLDLPVLNGLKTIKLGTFNVASGKLTPLRAGVKSQLASLSYTKKQNYLV